MEAALSRRRHLAPASKEHCTAEEEVHAGLVSLLPRLWRYGLVLSGQRDVAEDLVQATCVRAMERALQFLPGTRLDRWLFSILHSIWVDEVRARKVRFGGGLVEPESALVMDGEGKIETHVLVNQTLRLVDALPITQRNAVFLAYVEGLSYQEVAEVLNIPVGTVMSRLANARARLAEMVEIGQSLVQADRRI